LQKILSILFLSIILFHCKKEETNSDASKIVKEYVENPVFGSFSIFYKNSDYFFPEANKESFYVTSYFEKKKIRFLKKSTLYIPDNEKTIFSETNSKTVKSLIDSGEEFYTISNPILSEDSNYALLEVGRFNHIFGAHDMPDLVHVFLYKKENGNWKRLELITQIRL